VYNKFTLKVAHPTTIVTQPEYPILEDLKRWLAHQLVGVNSVRNCTIKREDTRDPERDPSLVVHTWSSTVIHVHVLTDIPKPRLIKRWVSENTRIGVGSLFLLNLDVLPDNGERFEPDETLVMLHALFKDKIYTYRIEDDGPRIGQVHFKNFGKPDQTEVWDGPDITITNLPAYRVWVKAPASIKGDWFIAGFGTEAFWKKAETSAARDEFRRQYRRSQGSTWQYMWTSRAGFGRTGTEPIEPPQPKPETKLDRSFAHLGVESSASYEEVKAAFRRMARELHPDVSHLPKEEAEAQFKLLNEAYTYIKISKRWT